MSSLQNLSRPISVEANPLMPEVNATVMRWVKEHEMLDESQLSKFEAAGVATLSSYTSPKFDYDSLVLSAKHDVWLFCLDDVYCDESEFGADPIRMAAMSASLSQIVDGLTESTELAGRCASGLVDLCESAEQRMDSTQFGRWRQYFKQYLAGIVWESANRFGRRMPTLDEYVFMRRTGTSGVLPTFALFPATARLCISEKEWWSPGVQELNLLAANIICWDNDILSYPKELQDFDAMHNIVTMTMQDNHGEVGGAIELVINSRNAEMNRLVSLSRELIVHKNGIRDYVECVLNWVCGYLEFSLQSSRYDEYHRLVP